MSDHLSASLQEESLTSKMIFVVDDDKDLGEVICEAVRLERTYQVTYTEGSIQALEIIEHFRPQLFLLDYQMPKMNGIELYHQLQRREGFEAIPVLFMTASTKMQNIEALGFPVLKKPFTVNALLQALDTLLAET